MRRPNKKELKRRYGRLFDAAQMAINDADPIGLLSIGCPQNEYEPEVGTVLPRLRGAHSAEAVQRILHEEFCHWFSDEMAGPLDLYAAPAEAIWRSIRALGDR